jgi:hypothetical protein
LIDKKKIDLVNRDIDGLTMPDEHARLLAMMEADHELRQLHDDLSRLAHALSGVERTKAPAALKHGVMREVEKRAYVPHRPSPLEKIRGAFQRWSALEKGLSMAGAGIALVLVVALATVLYRPGPVSERDLAGTFSLLAGEAEFGESVNYSIGGTGQDGTVTATYGKNLCLVRVALQSPGITSAEFSFDPSTVKVDAIRPSSDLASRLDVRSGRISVSGGPVENLVAVFSPVESSQSVVNLRVIDMNGRIAERTIPLHPPVK